MAKPYNKNRRKPNRINDNYKVDASQEILETSIEKLNFHPKTYQLLLNNKLLDINSIASKTEKDLYKIQGFNKRNLQDIKTALGRYNLDIRPPIEFNHDNSDKSAVDNRDSVAKINVERNNNTNNRSNNNTDNVARVNNGRNLNATNRNNNTDSDANKVKKSFKDIINSSLQTEKQGNNTDRYQQNANDRRNNRSRNDRKSNDKSKRGNKIPHKESIVSESEQDDKLKKYISNGKYGYKDNKNKVVIPPVYDEIFAFKEDLACVELNQYYGFIDINNNVVIEADKYELAMSFSEGYAAVMLNGKYGYINKSGEMVIKPQYDAATSFEDGIARVKYDGKWGSIDNKGTLKLFK